MIQLIVGIFKYSILVLVILVLSHVIQIKGVTISRHVENAMNWVSGVNPSQEVDRTLNRSMSEIRKGYESHYKAANDAAEFPTEDQKQLNQVIEKSQKKK